MITASERCWLAGRTATARVQQGQDEARREAYELRLMLEGFSARLHAFARTPEGQARAQYWQDKEWHEARAAWELQRERQCS